MRIGIVLAFAVILIAVVAETVSARTELFRASNQGATKSQVEIAEIFGVSKMAISKVQGSRPCG